MLLRLRNRILPLAWYEMVLGLRSASGLTVLVLCCGVGLVVGGADGMTPSLVAYRVSRIGAIMLGFICLPLLASAARRDSLTSASDVVQSRPQQAHELLLARWIGNYAYMLALLIVSALFAFASQAIFSGTPVEGAGPRVSVRAFFDAILAGGLPLMFLCALGYCAAELLQNVLAAAIVALYWLLVLLGRDYLSRVFDFSLSQNALAYIIISAGVVFAAMATVRYRQGLSGARKLNVPLMSAACLVIGLGLAYSSMKTRHDPPMSLHPLAQNVAGQSIRCGRLPGFWLQDQYGKRTRLHEFEGKTLVVAFWSPAVGASVDVLSALQRIDDKYAARGVQVVGVCLADDWSIGRRFARERGYRFPMVTDNGTHWAEKIEDASPLAEAYEVQDVPTTFVADGDRNLVARIATPASTHYSAIDAALANIFGDTQPAPIAGGS